MVDFPGYGFFCKGTNLVRHNQLDYMLRDIAPIKIDVTKGLYFFNQ